jgi:molybdopterin-guanine dinucleotide biosynthesis protein A
MASAIVLAGGAGTRLGRPKAAATLAGRPLVEHVLAAAREGGLEPIVVARADSALPPLDCPVVIEPAQPRHPLCGSCRLGGDRGRRRRRLRDRHALL